ncbi:LytR C-terminal domain-containing protein [Mycobacterium sp. CVI_P3]|uniref:LytR C-terminal domain-containing protein n=1 Tax=Mycobacterium pinniadriaticum TaxID=2994102 RepID=A0ABT3SMM5_9MYCO|nr:LytR C-terminal domain-containing protein [Mycobacterium pinniadriaticum]MCX2934180.1 LytR C-terminal domain-containing protein [Mycobacterium pinniadriaticum]MCX2940602.1 LytR C-terminal domain-containing protein [Mycobacterium pinniadriaticum]
MNDRVPDSAGLPLRAMVMVLLFLGVIFLLVGFQAMGSGNDSSSDDTSVRTVTTTTTKTSVVPTPKADVRVYNVGGDEGAAGRVGDRLREAGWNVTETSNLEVPPLPETTVYYGTTDGEQASAEEVAKVLSAPVAPRIPEIAEQPPGVIVLVTG